MAKLYDFQWQLSIPEDLRQGCLFDRWEEVSNVCACNHGNILAGDP